MPDLNLDEIEKRRRGARGDKNRKDVCMENEKAVCEICGEPMPAGEEMFKFHGYSGPCPRPALPRTFGFGAALERLKVGGKVQRKGWNGKGMWLQLQRPDENSKMTLPYIYIEYPHGHPAYPAGSRVPWLGSQTDLLSEDWMEA